MSIELLKREDGKMRYVAKCEYCSAAISTEVFVEDKKKDKLDDIKEWIQDLGWEHNENNKCWCPNCT